MKKGIIVPLICLLVCMVAGCSKSQACDHVWGVHFCNKESVCELCGATDPAQGEVVHSWYYNCEENVCVNCNLTEKSEHKWVEATCAKAKTCSRCKKTEGEPLGHTLVGPTCTERAVCTTCKYRGEDALGHDYTRGVCNRCQETAKIESFFDLEHFLEEQYSTVHTAIGDIDGLNFEIIEPNYDVVFSQNDFDVHIEGSLMCEGHPWSFSGMLVFDYYTFEERVQAFADLLTYEMEVARTIEAIFPDKKFSLCFFEDGYKYPGVQVGYISHEYLKFYNYKSNDSGASGYASTSLCDWYMREVDGFLTPGMPTETEEELYRAVIEKTGYTLYFQGFKDQHDEWLEIWG